MGGTEGPHDIMVNKKLEKNEKCGRFFQLAMKQEVGSLQEGLLSLIGIYYI